MPVFTCGGMRYQHKWQDVPPGEIPADGQANVEACIERALALGINHIETARGYGTSEMQLGRILPRLPREKLIVQTKVAPTADPTEFRATFEKSMAYLGLDHVELLSFHGINTRQLLDWTIRPGGCLAVARQLQREGRARFVGFSTHATTDIILAAVETGEFDYVNLHWYFVNELNWPAVEAARRRDMGVFIISPNDKGGRLQDRPALMAGLTAPLSPMQFNDLFCFARPEIHTLSLGVSKPSDFDEHVAILPQLADAAQIVAPLEAKLRARLREVHGAEWCARWPRACHTTSTCPARSTSPRSCGCGPMAPGSTSCRGQRCATTCSARPTTGSRGRTPRRPAGSISCQCWQRARSPRGSPRSSRAPTPPTSRRRRSGSARAEPRRGSGATPAG